MAVGNLFYDATDCVVHCVVNALQTERLRPYVAFLPVVAEEFPGIHTSQAQVSQYTDGLVVFAESSMHTE